MRIRETITGGFTTQCVRKNYIKASCAAGLTYSHDTPGQFIGTQKIKKIIDCSTPGYHSLLREGRFLPLNPVTIITTEETRKSTVTPGYLSGDWSTTCSAYMARAEGTSWALLSPRLAVLPPIDSQIVNSVANAAIANCKSSLFDALTTLAEMKETLGLIKTQWGRVQYFALKAARYARSVYDFVFRRQRRKSPLVRRQRSLRAQSRAFASKWLEYRYGWLPSIYAVQDLIKAMENELKEGSIIKGRAAQTTNLSDSGTDVLTFTGQSVTYTDVLTGTRTYRGTAYAQIVNASRFEFGFDSALTAWERIPFSFVVDWFLGVGNWLKAWSPISGTSLLGSMVSVKDDYSLKQSYYQTGTGGTSPSDLSGNVAGNDTTVLTVKSYERFPHGASLLPAWNPRLNATRIADLIALFLGGKDAVRRAMR